jgi:hypothetical protein
MPEQIMGKLREAEVHRARGKTAGRVCLTWSPTEHLLLGGRM